MDRIKNTWRTLFVGSFLAAATLATFQPVLHNAFINYDDPLYITLNTHLTGGLIWANVKWAFQTGYGGNWHPLTWLSHMLDVQWFGLNAGRHHLTSLLLHVANTLLLFLVLKRMTGAQWRSALVAALFALHPLHVESVAWIAERKDVLSAFFFMLTLWAYARYAEGRRKKEECRMNAEAGLGGTVRPISAFCILPSYFFFLSLLFFTLGLMSKPMLVTLPFILLLLDYWPLRRFQPALSWLTPSARRFHPSSFILHPLLLEKVPFLALSAAASVVTVLAQWNGGAVETLDRVPVAARLINALLAGLGYLEKMVWPARLAILYLRPEQWPLWRVGLAVFVLGGISVLVGVRGRDRGWLTVGWLWFLGMLVPVSGLVQVGNQYMADRYSYLPLIGLFIIVAWGGWEVAGQPKRWWLALAALMGLAAAGAVTQRQVGLWQNSETIFGHCLAVTANNHVAHNNLGAALALHGRAEEAHAHFEAAWRLQPHDADTLCNLGVSLTGLGKFDEGAPYLAEGVGIKPELGDIYGKLGLLLDGRGSTAQAIACYREGLRVRPGQVEIANNLAWILATNPDPRLRDGNEAIRLAEQACKSSGYKLALVVGTLAAAYAEAGRFSQAVTAAEQAIALATAAGQPELADRNRQLLALYRARQPFHEKSGGEAVR